MSDSVLGICVYMKSLISHILVSQENRYIFNTIQGFAYMDIVILRMRGSRTRQGKVFTVFTTEIFQGYMFYILKCTAESLRARTCHILTIYISQILLMSLLRGCTYSIDYSRRNNLARFKNGLSWLCFIKFQKLFGKT